MAKNYLVGYYIKADRTERLYYMVVEAQNKAAAMAQVKKQVYTSIGRNAFRPFATTPTWVELMDELNAYGDDFARMTTETFMEIEFDETGVMPRWDAPASKKGMQAMEPRIAHDWFGRRLR